MLKASVLALLAGCAALSCAGTPPPRELLDARAAYMRAESGPAAQLKPDKVHEAKVALDKAELAYADDPGGDATKDIAYLATRSAELAEVEGRDAKFAQDKVHAEKELASLNQSQLSRTREQLASASEGLASERAARDAAEKRSKDAMDKLAASAAVKHDTRGTVITIPGSVLFATGKSAVLPGAQDKLNSVADALKETDHSILVEGYTDSQGSDAFNLELSQTRAQNVRDYLVSRGVPESRIRAQGLGESKPVGDNKTTDGRAQNRRVEIIVSGEDKSMPSTVDTPYPAGKPSSGGAVPFEKK
jgi:outer membrane protein OmpA-like peptidoglycan-associated protein